MEIVITISVIACIVAPFAVLIFCIVKYVPDEEARRAEEMLDEPVGDLDIETVEVTVLTLRCGVGNVGLRLPKTVKGFIVTFLTDEGESLEFSVSEEFYLSLKEGERGTLALLDGALYDFVSDNA